MHLMHRILRSRRSADSHHIQIRLRDINQLFNTMDPSPFYEKDLDDDAEQFLVGWAQEFPRGDPLILTIRLCQGPSSQIPDPKIEEAVQHYFSYRAGLIRMEFHRLMRDGRLSLIIGLVFLFACLTSGSLLLQHGPPALERVASEGLTIFGWVAMWRPLEIYLYDWWPVRRRWKIYEKMSHVKVEIQHEA